jgi:hypothetical protein
MPHHMKFPLRGTGPSDDTMQKVSVAMTTMAETLAHQHEFVVARSKKKTTGFAKLGSHAKKLILFASTQDGESEASEPLPAVFLSSSGSSPLEAQEKT